MIDRFGSYRSWKSRSVMFNETKRIPVQHNRSCSICLIYVTNKSIDNNPSLLVKQEIIAFSCQSNELLMLRFRTWSVAFISDIDWLLHGKYSSTKCINTSSYCANDSKSTHIVNNNAHVKFEHDGRYLSRYVHSITMMIILFFFFLSTIVHIDVVQVMRYTYKTCISSRSNRLGNWTATSHWSWWWSWHTTYRSNW
jgi:hypothetical protein